MTVEIAILNKSAVALATDSAVTVGGKRIFNTGDKLFMLSKVHPVGVMIYQDINLMGVPWETIIKTYRKQLGSQKFDSVQEYCDHFIAYLQANRLLFPEEMQTAQFSNRTSTFFEQIRDEAYEDSKKEETLRRANINLKTSSQEATAKITGIFEEILSKKIDEIHKKAHPMTVLDCFKDIDVTAFTEKHKGLIGGLVKKSFEKFEVSSENLEKLISIAIDLFLKTNCFSWRSNQYSGLVIAGFGDKEIFPTVIHYAVEEIFDNRTKITFIERTSVAHDKPVDMLAFAQPNFVKTFLNGIDPDMRNYVRGELPKAYKGMKEKFFAELSELSEDRKKALSDKMDGLWKGEVEQYYEKIGRYEIRQFKFPMGSFISALSKSELASMAETFVQLTSFKVKITSELESVGGPIDVAVISKGDGFVWVKRKHYFDVKYNPHFVENYMNIEEKLNEK